jgi:hypothetical protein
LFPVIESLFFFGLGVNVLAARLVVSLAVAVSVLLFYRLLIATHGSHALAICSTLTFFSMKLSQGLANDVMLEFPALAFILGSLYCLRDLGQGYQLRRGLSFAILAGAAVWTKQHAVFLVAVPFFCILISRHWRLLAGKTIWISSLLFSAMVIAFIALSLPFNGAGALQASTVGNASRSMGSKIFIHYLQFYKNGILEELGILPVALIAAAFVAFRFAPRREKTDKPVNAIYLAWSFASLLSLLLSWHYATRYLFFVYPALIVLGYVALFRLCSLFLPPTRVWYIPAAFAGLYIVFHLNTSFTFLHGPSQAAQCVVTGLPNRVLYCGQTDGSFIFSVRSLDPALKTVVIRGEKLPASTFVTDEFETFAHRYGINYIVLEQTAEYSSWTSAEAPKAWNLLRLSPSPSMVLEHVIPLTSSRKFFNGNLHVYRFTNPSPTPESLIKVPVKLLKDNFDIQF